MRGRPKFRVFVGGRTPKIKAQPCPYSDKSVERRRGPRSAERAISFIESCKRLPVEGVYVAVFFADRDSDMMFHGDFGAETVISDLEILKAMLVNEFIR